MALRNRDGILWYRIYIDGREVESKSTGLAASASNQKAAQEQHDRRRAELLSQTARVGRDIAFDVAATDFVRWCYDVEYRGRRNTARRIDVSMRSLVVHFGRQTVSTIGPADVERYKSWRATVHQVRDVTIRHDLHNLNLFFRYARKQGWCESSPVDEVKIPSDRDAIRIHVVTAAEEKAYFAAARKTRTLFDVAKLILLQGCRPEEVLALRAEHVDLKASTMFVAGGKTRSARRTLKLTTEGAKILARRVKASKDWLFPSSRSGAGHVVKLNAQHDRACLDAGVSFILYDLRHTFATRHAEMVHPSEASKSDAMANYDALLSKPRLKVLKRA